MDILLRSYKGKDKHKDSRKDYMTARIHDIKKYSVVSGLDAWPITAARQPKDRDHRNRYIVLEFKDGDTIALRESQFDVFAVIKNKKRKRRGGHENEVD